MQSYSHALAKFHWRRTVRSPLPRIRTISSLVRPPKNFQDDYLSRLGVFGLEPFQRLVQL